MKFIPTSGSLRSTRNASARSFGSAQIPGPVIRMAPNPKRFISISPPIRKVPARDASSSFMKLLPDTEAGENPPQQVLVAELPADLVQRLLRAAQLLGDELPRAAFLEHARGLFDAGAGAGEGLDMPLTRGDAAALQGVIAHAGFQMCTQTIHAMAGERGSLDAWYPGGGRYCTGVHDIGFVVDQRGGAVRGRCRGEVAIGRGSRVRGAVDYKQHPVGTRHFGSGPP